MPRQSVLLVVRGLGLAVLLTLLLFHVATPRTHVTPGERLTPSGPSRQGGEAAPERRPTSASVGRSGGDGRTRPAPMGRRDSGRVADRFGTD
jgi:hypothetical protein